VPASLFFHFGAWSGSRAGYPPAPAAALPGRGRPQRVLAAVGPLTPGPRERVCPAGGYEVPARIPAATAAGPLRGRDSGAGGRVPGRTLAGLSEEGRDGAGGAGGRRLAELRTLSRF